MVFIALGLGPDVQHRTIFVLGISRIAAEVVDDLLSLRCQDVEIVWRPRALRAIAGHRQQSEPENLNVGC